MKNVPHSHDDPTQISNKTTSFNIFEKIFIWLSGSDRDLLNRECPKWEKIKYEAYGAAVLVPVLFGMIAACYAVSTLVSNWYIIIGFTLVWGFIIMTIDRLLLSTYRAYTSRRKKLTQFTLRATIAILMGMTVSHPVTLLLFKDTISREIERDRETEIHQQREHLKVQTHQIDNRIQYATSTLAVENQNYQKTLAGDIVLAVASPASTKLDPSPSFSNSFDHLDVRLATMKTERDTIRVDLERWQQTYDEEVRGVRSGKYGVGPNARAIQRDHIEWRQQEVARLDQELHQLNQERNQMSSAAMRAALQASTQIETSRLALRKQSLDLFSDNQAELLAAVKKQIDATTATITNLRDQSDALAAETEARIDAIRDESRSDLLTQTLALHHLFSDQARGGWFALSVYLVLTGLFVAIDTLPLITKFFSVAGPYDSFLSFEEKCYHPLSHDQPDEYRQKMMQRADHRSEIETYIPKVYSPTEAPQKKIAELAIANSIIEPKIPTEDRRETLSAPSTEASATPPRPEPQTMQQPMQQAPRDGTTSRFAATLKPSQTAAVEVGAETTADHTLLNLNRAEVR